MNSSTEMTRTIRKKSFSDSCIRKESSETGYKESSNFFQKWFSNKKRSCSTSDQNGSLSSHEDFGKSPRFSPWKFFTSPNFLLNNNVLSYNRLNEPELNELCESRKNYSALISKDDERLVPIYTDNNTCYRIPVTKHVTALSVCQYVVKNNLLWKSFDACWSIVEYWGEFGIERVLEDHESVLKTFRKLEALKLNNCRLVIRRTLRKYSMFENEDLRNENIKPKKRKVDKLIGPTLESYGRRSDYFKIVRLPIKIILKENGTLCLFDVDLDNDSRHFVDDTDVLLSKYKTTNRSLEEYSRFDCLQKFPKGLRKNKEINIKDVDFYTTINAQTQFKATSRWGICLLRKNKLSRNIASRLFVITFATEELRHIWLNALRMAKYGDQLKENYKEYLNYKTSSNIDEPQFDIYPKDNTCNSDYSIYVYMDFSGPEGRIVDDPNEIKLLRNPLGLLAMDFNEEQNPYSRNTKYLIPQPKMCTLSYCSIGALEEEPWFHGKIDRRTANNLIKHYTNLKLGTFLIRLSLTNQHMLVLSFYTEEEIHHVSINIYVDKIDRRHVYSINNGVTTFLEIEHLVKFYQTDNDYLPVALSSHVENKT